MSREVRIFTSAIPPNDHHVGWVELQLDDVYENCTEIELVNALDCVLQGEFLNEVGMSEFMNNGCGVYDYDEKYLGVDCIVSIPESFFTQEEKNGS